MPCAAQPRAWPAGARCAAGMTPLRLALLLLAVAHSLVQAGGSARRADRAAQLALEPDDSRRDHAYTNMWRRGSTSPAHPLNFAVVGQMKCGTSSLFKYITSHPGVIAPMRKEILYWMFIYEKCDRSVVGYYDEIYRRLRRPILPESQLGEFSATYFSCSCCPSMLRNVNPDLKPIITVRHPIARAYSRFREAKKVKLPYYRPNSTFAETVETAMTAISACLMRAQMRLGSSERQIGTIDGPDVRTDGEAYHGNVSANPDNATFAGTWSSRGAPIPSALHLARVYCAKLDNFIGLSMYDIFVEHWLMLFPPAQLRVYYMEQLDAEPLAVMRSVEQFLGLTAHTYNETLLGLRFHASDCIGWNKGCNSTSHSMALEHAKLELGPDLYARLLAFFKPGLDHLSRLMQLGLGSPVPEAYYV